MTTRHRSQPGTPPDVFHIGVQYYVSARAAVRHGHGGVAGNLFHHGFEMMLRGLLLHKSFATVPQLIKKFGSRHDLPGLWSEAKKAVPTLDWGRFDLFIDQLHKWDRIRFGGFPEGIPKILLVDLARSINSLRGTHRISKVLQVDQAQGPNIQPSEAGRDVYRLSLEDADELFVVLVREMGWGQPTFVREKLIGLAAIGTYEWDNLHIIGEASYPRAFD
jgi:hypothetical protein